MSLPVEYRAGACEDAAQARDWYERERAGLGDRFVELLARTAKRIGDFPESSPEVHAGVRRALVPVFSYRVFYVIEPGRVVILAVHHPARSVPDFDALL